ncbi:MAG: FAD-dependent oxidoreductase, partial [Pseudomonadota bacterium]
NVLRRQQLVVAHSARTVAQIVAQTAGLCFVCAIAPERVLRRLSYSHPQFGPAAFAAQRRWARIDGRGRIHYCGAYWGYGFHEDAVVSAERVAATIDGR